MASIQVKSTEKLDMNEILNYIKQIQISLDQLQASVSRLAQQGIDMDSIKPKISEAFNIDFVKQVCYENDFDCKVIKLIIIYEHDDYGFMFDTIFSRFRKLKKQLPGLLMEMVWYSKTEVELNDLKNTTTVFKRE